MKKLIVFSLVVMLLGGFSTKALSWGGHYHYGRGHYYRDAGWWGFGGFVSGLAVGAYVASLPPQYETVVIGGVPYYYADGYYYQAGPSGYMVVAPPASQGQQADPPGNGNNPLFYVLGILFGIILLLCIGLLIKRLLASGPRSA